MQSLSTIASDITKAVGASSVQFMITLVTTPIMTRLFAPEAYASFGIINTMAVTMVGIGLLSMPNAYTIEKDPALRRAVVQTMICLLAILVGVATIIGLIMALTRVMQFERLALVLLPVLVLTYGTRQILVSVATVRAHFNSLALGQMVEPLCSRGGSIALGTVFGGHPALILVAVALGHLSNAVLILKMVLKDSLHQWRGLFQRVKPFEILRRYADFVVFNTASTQAMPLTMLAIQLAMVTYFSAHLTGHYILANSILGLPVSLVAMTSSTIVYRHLIEVERTNPAQLLRHLCKSMGFYLMTGFVVMLPIILFGPALFSFAFGEVWNHAGKIASLLGIAYVSTFALTGVQSIFRVTRRLKIQFKIEATGWLLTLVVAFVGLQTLNFDTAILYLSIAWCIRNTVLLLACMLVANQHSTVSRGMHE